ncbi:PGF-CTERM sorting domain-containing protein [Halorubrum rutilum]|uniref:PGF-CTERM sorting domain-containing protein n=1 Tax=Halorubrum rutilum TaxID=1364933 RepID=A0ABD6APK5_9EURY|nr:PGF-CTERM sorting domain-containing protein [Halorubrum rutilum]
MPVTMRRRAPLGCVGRRVTQLTPVFIVGMILIGLVAFAGSGVFLTASPETPPVGADTPVATADTFEHAPASISITAVGPVDNETAVEQPTTSATIRPNETTPVRGETNLAPDDTVVIVELRTENGTFIASNTTDEWGADGAWSTALNTSGLTPGIYVLEVETTETTDQVEVAVVPSDSASTTTSETHSTAATTQSNTTSPETETTVTTAEEPSTNSSPAVTEAGGSDADGGSTNATATTEGSDLSTPGFGFLTALVAVVIVSAVASRRR